MLMTKGLLVRLNGMATENLHLINLNPSLAGWGCGYLRRI